MATKRRKVWVEFDEYGTGDDPVVHFGRFPRAVPMVERLPGDVVLSREEVDAIAGKLMDAKAVEYDAPSVAMYLNAALALLRGRR